MKLFEKFINNSTLFRQLLDIYLELRQHFQELNFSESDLESPPEYTNKMMILNHKFRSLKSELYRQVVDFGIPMTTEEFLDFVQNALIKINEITPLKDGNTEGRDTGNEDY
jgi:hypothetical protein